MPRRKISFDVAVNMQSATREADRVANIFKSRLGNIQVGTAAGRGGAGGGGTGGGGGSKKGGFSFGPFGDQTLGGFLGNTAGFAVAGMFYKFFSDLPKNIAMLDTMATANRRAAASFETLAGGTKNANDMIDAYIQGTGNIADRTAATTSAMRLFNIGMADNAKEMRVFTTLSRGMSQALGRDVGYIEEQLSLALANQSMLRFDQLGLSIERHQEIMEDLQKQYPELSREVIFQNAMLTQATERYYNLSLAQEALATTTEVASRELRNQQAIFADMVSRNIMQPMAGNLAGMMGAQDLNLNSAWARQRGENFQWQANNLRQQNSWAIPNMIDMAVNQLVGGGMYQTQEKNRIAELEKRARMADSLVRAGDTAQAARNMGIELNPSWEATIRGAALALDDVDANTGQWITKLEATRLLIEMAIDPTDLLGKELIDLEDAGARAAQTIADVNAALTGIGASLVQKLIEEGMAPNQAIGMVGSQADFNAKVAEWEAAGAFKGDEISDAAAMAVLKEQFFGPAEDWLDAAQESEANAKRAASALESAAEKAEKAFVNAADEIVDTFDRMLKSVPGLFGTSDVTEGDLELAKLGEAVNYADDYLRRVKDVAENKVKRDDVDMGLVRQALGLAEDTPDKVTAARFEKAWESGALWSNPENIEKFLNLGAVRDELKNQEMGALGTQNLEAFFGIGTEEGKEFLKVFGVQALDPIQDGLISEITTRGPIMGETLAEFMHEGFKTKSMTLPWVATLLGSIDGAVARAVANLNIGASSNLADAEALPTE